MTKESLKTSVIKIRIGKIRLMLPATELFSIIEDFKTLAVNLKNRNDATIIIDNMEIPVYTLDEELHLVPYHKDDWPCCLCLDDGKYQFGMLCDEAILAESSGFTHYEVPECMNTVHNPIHGLVVDEGTVFCNTDTGSLFRLIE